MIRRKLFGQILLTLSISLTSQLVQGRKMSCQEVLGDLEKCIYMNRKYMSNMDVSDVHTCFIR